MIQHHFSHQPHQCFENLYNRYVRKVYERCLSITKDSDQAQDFTHDIFLKAFDKLSSFEQRSRFSTWLYSIAHNYCVDQIRLARRLPTTALDESGDSAKDDSFTFQLHEESLQLMRQALDQLNSQERAILRLKYEDGTSIEDIAKLYNIKISAVKMRLKRSREKVQHICTQLYATR